mmetsp:Transcript_102855/g.291265  ORF Transcript_102855/g.291265 Transcript_102855/m.291265 type:complete len:278 (+) Transcript_102855:1304-2137(+)
MTGPATATMRRCCRARAIRSRSSWPSGSAVPVTTSTKGVSTAASILFSVEPVGRSQARRYSTQSSGSSPESSGTPATTRAPGNLTASTAARSGWHLGTTKVIKSSTSAFSAGTPGKSSAAGSRSKSSRTSNVFTGHMLASSMKLSCSACHSRTWARDTSWAESISRVYAKATARMKTSPFAHAYDCLVDSCRMSRVPSRMTASPSALHCMRSSASLGASKRHSDFASLKTCPQSRPSSTYLHMDITSRMSPDLGSSASSPATRAKSSARVHQQRCGN